MDHLACRVEAGWQAAGEAMGVMSERSGGQVEKQTLQVGGGCERPWARGMAGGLLEDVGVAVGSSRPGFS